MGCGEGERRHFLALWQKGDVSSSIALAGRGFLPKSCLDLLIKYLPLCNLQTETFLQNPILFFPCIPKFMSDILCGCGMLRKEKQLFVIGWGLLRPQDEWRLSWVISVIEQASLHLTVESKIFVILMFGNSTLKFDKKAHQLTKYLVIKLCWL